MITLLQSIFKPFYFTAPVINSSTVIAFVGQVAITRRQWCG